MRDRGCLCASPRSGSERSDRRAGQVIIFVTLSLFFLFSVMGLAVDLGYSYYTKVAAQGAADAAATAAATYASNNGYACITNIDCSGPYTCPNTLGIINTAFKAGCAYAQSNGFTGGGSQTVTMSANSTASPYVSGISTALWILLGGFSQRLSGDAVHLGDYGNAEFIVHLRAGYRQYLGGADSEWRCYSDRPIMRNLREFIEQYRH
jgi:hypothetical protein